MTTEKLIEKINELKKFENDMVKFDISIKIVASVHVQKQATYTTLSHILFNVTDAVCEICNTTFEKLKSKKRPRQLCEKRFIVYHILKKIYNIKESAIATYFEFDRATIYHGIDVAGDLLLFEKEFLAMYNLVLVKLGKVNLSA